MVKRKSSKAMSKSLQRTENIQENPYIPKPYKILDHFRETYDTFTITVDMKIDHDPGQFVQLSIPGIGECPISICSYSKDYIKMNIREVGDMTKILAKLKVGDTVLIRGPYGKGYPMHHFKDNDIILLGGGCGIAPLRGVIEYIERNRADFKEVSLFLGYRSPRDIIFRTDMEEWNKKYNLHITVDENAHGEFCYDAQTGFVTEALKNTNFTNEKKIILICGPPVMMKSVIEILKSRGFNDDQIFISAERLMYCALGICCHCMIHGKFTCKDGPVFRLDEIKSYTND